MPPLPNWAIWVIVVASILCSPLVSMFLVFIAGEALFDAAEVFCDFLSDADVPVRLTVLVAGLAAVAGFWRWRGSPASPRARTAAGRSA